MQRPRFCSPGWAAFDRRQRAERDTGSDCDVDPFPSLSNMASTGPMKSSMTNNFEPTKSFASVLRPSLELPLFGGNGKGQVLNNASGAKLLDHQVTAEANDNAAVKMLKDVHSWADQNVIEDILAAVNDDVDQASVFLKSIVSPDPKIEKTSACGPSSSIENEDKCLGESIAAQNKLPDDANKMLLSAKLFSVPAEPEWEDDDVYIRHRKDAIRMMRVASQHSQAASNAYLRGDHISAHQQSLRAQEEWLAAEKLNTRAAEQIFRIRNEKNDIWKLDLHGLHASEAVNALKEHLHKIESKLILNRSASSDGLAKLEAGILCSQSLESVEGLDSDAQKKAAAPRQRQTVLHVITGTGSHSRGQAALPSAIRSFLIENRYRFYDARPGVFVVHPKFRHN